MLKLYQFPKPKRFPNFSPFCVKLETYLKIANIPYQPIYTLNLAKNPKKKMPYVEINGEIIGDSTFIINKLIQMHGDKVDNWLTAEQHEISTAFQRLLENHLTSIMVYFRGIYPPGLQQFSHIVLSKSGNLAKYFGKYFLKAKLARRFKYSPVTAGFTVEEILARATKDLDALSLYLGNKPYFFGDRPCSLDAMLLGVYGGIIHINIDTPLKNLANQYTNLKNHSSRMLENYYSAG